MILPNSKTLIEIQDLKMHFFTDKGIVKAVDGVNFDIRKGEAVGLVGESGCGKTMTALCLMRLVPRPGRILSGKVLFHGEDLLLMSDKKIRNMRGEDIAMIFQDPSTYLNPVIRVGDQIAESINLHQQKAKDETHKTVIDLLGRVEIPDPERVSKFYPHELSGGMRQRTMIAMALSCNPSLLIADEPTTALDVTVQAQILALLNELKRSFGMSVLFITHDLGIVAGFCDRVNVMYCGKIVEQGDVNNLYEKPLHPYTVGLLNAAYSIDENRNVLSTIRGVVPNLINPPSGCRFHPRCDECMNICKQEEPLLLRQGKPDRSVACYLYNKT